MFRKMIEAAVERALDRRSDLIEAAIKKAVEKEIESRTVRPDKKLTLDGYHPLPEIKGLFTEWLFVPFRGKEVLVEVRYLRSSQLPDVDKLSHLKKEENKNIKLTHQEKIDYLNIQEECCRAILKRPTFEELECAIHGNDNIFEIKRKELKELRKEISTASRQEQYELQAEIEKVELFAGYILPDDTMHFLTNIALGINVSDIQKVTREKLVDAYSKARLYNDRPSDYIPGLFTDGDRKNIDDYATMLGLEEEAKSKKNQKG